MNGSRAAREGAGQGDAVALTYFEFGTLAALDLFARAGLDVAILEVGLGGRLDAVNIIDADVAIVTTVDLDHMDWLGPDRDSIGREKAGIARAGRPVIVGELDPPAGLLDALAARGAQVERAGLDFRIERHIGGWHWRHRDGSAMELPDPALAAPVQVCQRGGRDCRAACIALAGDPSITPKDFYAAVGARSEDRPGTGAPAATPRW